DIPDTITTRTLLKGEFKRGYIQSFNFFVQRQLPGNLNFQAGYAGTRSIHQALTSFELNPGVIVGAGINGRPLSQKFGIRTSRSGAMLARGWQLNAVFSAYTGLPFSAFADGTSLNAPQNSQVADQIVQNIPKPGGIGVGLPYYDRAAFLNVSQPRFGTSSLNSLRGPGMVNCDLGIFRSFKASERFNLQFRAEAFNFTNTPHFENPGQSNSNNNVTNSGFMYITTALQDQRKIRLGLRLAF